MFLKLPDRIAAMRIVMLACLAGCSLPASFAQTDAASVDPRGDVTINGKRVQGPARILPGEILKTENGDASISREGLAASVGSHVSIRYRKDSVDMECGWVEVRTVQDFAVRIHDVSATPKGDGWKSYEVKQDAHGFAIHDTEGSIELDEGKQVTTLTSGETRHFDRATPCAQAIAYRPWIATGLFGVSTFPIWEDLHDRHPITPSKP